MAITEAEILQAETMIASSWPSLCIVLSGRWVLGMADGLSGRANALFFLDPHDDDRVSERLDWMEETYAKAGLPARVRLSPLAPVSAVEQLKRRGYLFQNPTLTLSHRLENFESANVVADIRFDDTVTAGWLDTFIAASGRFGDRRDVLHHMLSAVLDETFYGTLTHDDMPVSTTMCIRRMDCATVQNVATRPDFRARGFGRSMMDATLNEAKKRGVRWCFVAVEQSNQVALQLYRKAGFHDFYRYIYAVREAS